jgi:hypothetical protein
MACAYRIGFQNEVVDYIYNNAQFGYMKNEADRSTPIIGSVPKWMADYIKTKERGHLSRLLRIAIQQEFDNDKKIVTEVQTRHIQDLILEILKQHRRTEFTKTEVKTMLWKEYESDMVDLKCNKDDAIKFALSELCRKEKAYKKDGRYRRWN